MLGSSRGPRSAIGAIGASARQREVREPEEQIAGSDGIEAREVGPADGGSGDDHGSQQADGDRQADEVAQAAGIAGTAAVSAGATLLALACLWTALKGSRRW